ncbi:hypothetical protein JTB14_012750 [Gonioctena quinquepunctata]|nr:hypothetical protein JTB14_012750 [Gonioctena quinquepunctata]
MVIGANKELLELGKFLQTDCNNLKETFNNEGVEWKFIPAHAPNFGGLSEAGIKSCKHHLKRVLANVSLTFEGYCTLLTQVEAILNSRPLVPLSSDPNDFDVLTPSHFLIGRRLTSLPDPDVQDIPDNRLSRVQHIQKLNQHFWTRWSKEYLVELQTRNKWRHPMEDLKIGDLVLIRDDKLPPLQWNRGRVIAVHPGPDSKCQVADIRTQNGVFKRSITKLSPLPVTSVSTIE